MKLISFSLFSLFVLFSFNLSSQSTWDDFDNPGQVSYPFFNGTIYNQSFTNPSTSGINTSVNCAQYARHSGSQYDVILVEPIGSIKVGNVSDYTAGTKKMTMKIYSPAVGKTVQITLEDKFAASPTNYPIGRHSEYTAVTTVANNWETLTFNLVNIPDTNVADTGVNRLVLLFDPNSFNSDTYLFDDLLGPSLIDPCSSIPNDSTIGDDYECQRNVSFDFSNGTHLQNEMNPVTSGINSSTTCGKFIKFLPPTNDGAFGGTLLYPFVSTKFNTAHIELYSPAGAYDFKMVFQDAMGNDILDTMFTTSSTTNWTKFNMDLTTIPASTSIEKFVFLLNAPTATADSIFLDNFSFSFDPTVGVKENKVVNTVTVFPNPVLDQVTISSTAEFQQIVVSDLSGKTVLSLDRINNIRTTLNLENLLAGAYLIRVRDKEDNIITKRIIKSLTK